MRVWLEPVEAAPGEYVDNELQFRRLLDGEISGLSPLRICPGSTAPGRRIPTTSCRLLYIERHVCSTRDHELAFGLAAQPPPGCPVSAP